MRGLSPVERIKINRIFKTCRIDIDPAASTQGGAHQQVKLRIRLGLSIKTARDHTFDLNQNDGSTRSISVEQYFLEQYNIRLQHPDLPLVETKPETYYPIELCSFTKGNKYNKRLSPEQTAKANPIQLLK